MTATVGLQAAELLTQRFGKEDARTANVMPQLAWHYSMLGDYEAAEVCATSRGPVPQSRLGGCSRSRATPCSFCCRTLARQAKRAVHLQAWYVRGLEALRAAHGPAHPLTISTLMSYGQCLGRHRGWQQAAKTLGDYAAQLGAAGLGQSAGAAPLLVYSGGAFDNPAAHLVSTCGLVPCRQQGRQKPFSPTGCT